MASALGFLIGMVLAVLGIGLMTAVGVVPPELFRLVARGAGVVGVVGVLGLGALSLAAPVRLFFHRRDERRPR